MSRFRFILLIVALLLAVLWGTIPSISDYRVLVLSPAADRALAIMRERDPLTSTLVKAVAGELERDTLIEDLAGRTSRTWLGIAALFVTCDGGHGKAYLGVAREFIPVGQVACSA